MIVFCAGLVVVDSIICCMVAGTGIFGELTFWALGEVEVEFRGDRFGVWRDLDLQDDR